ncbi:hypothetical protein DMP23_47625 [Amycolatopsis sp. A1MSW2902]|uniref:hypothetical protein n=1 Tax=Amycolatopsis sp. A1MSW2902 TaxID=687413 RepID=UPI00307DE24B
MADYRVIVAETVLHSVPVHIDGPDSRAARAAAKADAVEALAEAGGKHFLSVQDPTVLRVAPVERAAGQDPEAARVR